MMNDKLNISVAIVVFSIINSELVVLVDRNVLPKEKFRASDSLDSIAQNVFKRVSNAVFTSSYSEQLYTFGSAKSIIIAYLMLSRPNQKGNTSWIPVSAISKLPKIQKEIVQYARKRLQWKLEYTNVAYSLLPPKFTLSELQKVYEIILERSLDKRNFRKKIFSLGILSNTKNKKTDVDHRPAELHCFKQRKPVIVEIL